MESNNIDLILLTKSYPFGKGEEFISGEIEILAKSFCHVSIIACQVDGAAVQEKAVPVNVSVYRFDFNGKKMNKILCLLRGISCILDKEVIDELRISPNIKAKGAVLYYIGKVKRLYPKIKRHLKMSENDNRKTVIYSYWLYDTADIACRIRDDKLLGSNCIAVSRAHGYDVYSERNAANFIPYHKYVIKKIDGIYICSDDGKEYLSRKYPEYKNKIKTSYLGTDDNGEALHLQDKFFHIVTCSWLAPIKRTDLLIDALCIVQRKKPNAFKWTCIGNGDLFETYQSRVKNDLIHTDVDMRGAMTRRQIYDFYRTGCVDLFISTSESEGLPVSIMEAQSFGIPTLCTDAGGTREITKNDITGRLLPLDISAEELAEEILRFSDMSEDEYLTFRKNSREFWINNFNAQTNYIKFTDDIKLLLEV